MLVRGFVQALRPLSSASLLKEHSLNKPRTMKHSLHIMENPSPMSFMMVFNLLTYSDP
jgi:hypothetical protein